MAAPQAAGARPARPEGGHDTAGWINRLTDWIERLPGPAWLAYVAFAAVNVGLSVGSAALEPGLAVGGPAASVYYAVLPWAMLGLIRLLDRTASQAMAALDPVLVATPAEREAFVRGLTVLPARPTVAITVAAVFLTALSYASDPVGTGVAGLSTWAFVIQAIGESFIGAIMFAIVYHTIRQLRLIPMIHARIGVVDPFRPGPLYAMASLTSTTGVGLVLLLAPSLFLLPVTSDLGLIALTAGWYGAGVGVALIAFVLPLRGIHQRLVAAKDALLMANAQRLRTTLDALDAVVDASDGQGIETQTRAMAALTAQRDILARLPTWPFSTTALTGFISAVMLPLGLWLVTRMLERFV